MNKMNFHKGLTITSNKKSLYYSKRKSWKCSTITSNILKNNPNNSAAVMNPGAVFAAGSDKSASVKDSSAVSAAGSDMHVHFGTCIISCLPTLLIILTKQQWGSWWIQVERLFESTGPPWLELHTPPCFSGSG